MKQFLWTLAWTALLAPTAAFASEPRYFEDASLRSVQFVGDTEAWAAGDEGAIWHTIDGGKNWERVPSGTRGSLRSICFITPHFGWIVGREELPRGISAGVVLFTTDGGVKWHRVLPNVLPGLNRVRFVDEKIGYLMGDGTDQHPSGLFKTTDGGRNWKPVVGPRATSWHDGDFSDGDTGALGGVWSRLAKMRGGEITAADVDTLGGRTVRGLRLMEERGIAIGDGGLVLVSKTKGAGWGYAKLGLPDNVLANMDFHGLDSIGNHVWVVGRPGSIIFHSADGGLNWEQQKTNQALPIEAVYFRDENTGLAVGALGTVLATTDGGKTWKVQRQGGKRAAALFIHAAGSAIPLEAVAQLGLEEGYLVTGVQVAAADPKTAAPIRTADEPRFAAALRLAGGATGETLWQFPLPQHLGAAERQQILSYWDSLHGQQAARQMLGQLVLALRIWRPEVVVTDHPDPSRSDSPAGSLIAEAVDKAVKMAADPNAFPEQLKHMGLQTWQAAKVYSLWDKQAGSHATMDGNEVKERLQTSLRDYCFSAAALLTLSPQLPGVRWYHLLDTTVESANSANRLMAGTEIRAGKDARRVLPPQPPLEPELAKALKDKRNLQLLAENPVKGLVTPEQLVAQLKPVLNKLPHDQGAAAAFALASQYARSGKWLLAQEVFLAMADQYPAHPLTAHAYRWLILHNTSGEARRRVEMEQYVATGQTEVIMPQFPTPEKMKQLMEEQKQKQGSAAKPGEPKTLPESIDNVDLQKHFKPVQLSTKPLLNQPGMCYLGNPAEEQRQFQQTKEFAERLKGFGPLLADDPAVQFCLQAANRNAGDFKTAHAWYRDRKSSAMQGPWEKAAAAEYWLSDRQGPPPRPVIECRPALSRPYLDGDLNDSCWQGIRPVVLEEAVNKTGKDYRTEVRLAYDQEFLYVALTCTHPPEFHVPAAKARARDEDLRAFDRVSLLLDLDRDYSTYYRLQIDQRGCVCEDCWGDQSWNPKWFVAVRSNKTSWNIEAAIPLTQLTGRPITMGTVWACNVVRILPGRGVQAVSLPADVEPGPEGMGLLMFLNEPAAQPIQPTAHTMPAAR